MMRKTLFSMGVAILLLGAVGATHAAPVYWDATAQNQLDVRADMLRLTTDVFEPNSLGTAIEGTFDFSETQSGEALVLSLADKALLHFGHNAYHSGADAYFHKNSDTTLRWGPWDGGMTLNQQLVHAYQDIVPFSLVLQEGILEMSAFGQTLSDSHDDENSRYGGDSYPWGEFKYGTDLFADLWVKPPSQSSPWRTGARVLARSRDFWEKTPLESSDGFSDTDDYLNSPDFAVAHVPEPGTIALLGIGLAGFAGKALRHRRVA